MTSVVKRRPITEPSTGAPGAEPGEPAIVRSRLHRWRELFLRHAPEVISRVAAVLGVLSVLDAFWPQRWHLISVFTPVLPSAAKATAVAVMAVSGVLLLRIAAGLRKRKRAEWRIAVAVCAVMSVADLVGDERRPTEAALTLVLLAALIAARSRYTARADPAGRWFAARVAAQFLAAAVGYGLVALYVPGHVPSGTTFAARLREVVLSIVGLGGWITIRGETYADIVHATLLGFGLLALSAGVLLAVRAPAPVAKLSECDENRLRALLAKHGARDSLGYFALRRDKSAVWSPSGKAAITYRVVYGVALVSGDPIGDPEAWPGAIDAYRRLVEDNGWTPAVMGCSELGATVFRREYGLAVLQLGDEAVLTVDGFALQGRPMRGVRQACTRVERAGYTVQVRRVRDVPAGEIEQLQAAAESWRGEAAERGYSMALSRLGDPADGDCVVVTAHQGDEVRGLLHFVPWSSDGISLDLMRRDRLADNGLNEFMIAATMQACAELGITRVSLNFAVFRDALERGDRIGAGPVLRLWRRILLVASRWWQIDSLFRFNAKFHPQWDPRFVCFPSVRDVPRVTLAALEAEAFFVRPQRVMRLLGRG